MLLLNNVQARACSVGGVVFIYFMCPFLSLGYDYQFGGMRAISVCLEVTSVHGGAVG